MHKDGRLSWFVASSRYGEDYVVPETKVDRHAFDAVGGLMEDFAKEFEVLSDRPEKKRKTENHSLNAVFDTMNSRNEESFERFSRLVEEDTQYVSTDEEEREESSYAGEDRILDMNEDEEDGKRGSTSEAEDESPNMEKWTVLSSVIGIESQITAQIQKMYEPYYWALCLYDESRNLFEMPLVKSIVVYSISWFLLNLCCALAALVLCCLRSSGNSRILSTYLLSILLGFEIRNNRVFGILDFA